LTEETKKKISASMKGHKVSAETKAKQGTAAKKAWANDKDYQDYQQLVQKYSLKYIKGLIAKDILNSAINSKFQFDGELTK
jgi:hypothetical protein